MSSTLALKTSGLRLKWVREQWGLNQSAFAKQLGLSLRGYQNYERDERPFPVALMQKVMEQFGALPLWVLNGEGEIWVDEEHTPIHLRGRTPKPAEDEHARLQRADARIGPILHAYALDDAPAARTALKNIALLKDADVELLDLVGSALDQLRKLGRTETPKPAAKPNTRK